MKQVESMLSALAGRLMDLARKNATVAKPIALGERVVVPLVEIGLGMGAGGGVGEGHDDKADGVSGKGVGGGAGGVAKASPVAVVVIEGGKVRLEGLAR
ncbi:MAG TPA: spore germination protein GerW family protein [Myxococcota bacterium]|nr:spore germination protein GerW family protein [Myxococcota bacterium]HRY92738.1 spore germination protein GerW family protein [Myxococcota bacterium]HSA20720.1 spore germination protein GerW family protein [Myxococcota bacterium]